MHVNLLRIAICSGGVPTADTLPSTAGIPRHRKRTSGAALNSGVRDDHTILGNHDDPIADIEALTGHFLVFVLW
jgi:hypothetical protein